MTLIFAHRGAAGTYPENTMLAFEKALEVGADGIELDVQLSADGEVVVIHDETIDRTTNGSGEVRNFTLQELQSFQASYTFNVGNRFTPIPTLREVFQFLTTNRLVCNIELKNSVVEYFGLDRKVFELIQEFGLSDRVIISSFHHRSLMHMKQFAPQLEYSPLYGEPLFQPWDYVRMMGLSSVHPAYRTLDTFTVQKFAENNIAIRCYTVNAKKRIKQALIWGVEAIFTDYPERAITLKKEVD
ncbi:glycerophosphodiester phosphodiesterase [Mangrovibacillus cuniculi]|uniref:Glycerophosphodiester phosphodiesterase n=1 Tax=Mangrovibacillus cuniculi TaxID=2593652 RepID=A0A7S8CBC9_9BACI|nr:glycerophosphodiester phosphodiesterase [Mangrovibacillus cuniculi]QPC46812.1 glycerophosphodiester phosphodiesterase [Mangrovibacillus cuniculi]